jgi:hypothetical protein
MCLSTDLCYPQDDINTEINQDGFKVGDIIGSVISGNREEGKIVKILDSFVIVILPNGVQVYVRKRRIGPTGAVNKLFSAVNLIYCVARHASDFLTERMIAKSVKLWDRLQEALGSLEMADLEYCVRVLPGITKWLLNSSDIELFGFDIGATLAIDALREVAELSVKI